MAQEKLFQVAAKALIVNPDGKVLVLREPAERNLGSQHGLYGLAGGRMGMNESFDQALHREVLEETGLKVDILYPIYVGEWTPVIMGCPCHIVALFNICRATTTKVKLSQEHDDYQWIEKKDVARFDFMQPDDRVIARYFEWRNKGLPKT